MHLIICIFKCLPLCFILCSIKLLMCQCCISVRYSNIFVTAPSPENLKAVHEFIFKGFEALHYQVYILLLTLTIAIAIDICGVQSCTAIHRIPRRQMGERPLDIEVSCEISGFRPDE